MATVSIVIGANYGDEGKGQTVHDLSNRETCVVRFNGGAQAGHTVVHHGSRNVFHQHGSGTYRGASTYLGPDVIVNPSVFVSEHNKFQQATMIVDKQCRVTTYPDMVINQLVEADRGGNRHGSCGMGIRETIVRHDRCPITFGNINQDDIMDIVLHVWKVVGPARLMELGCEHLIPEYFKELTEPIIRASVYEMIFMYGTVVKVDGMTELFTLFDNFVFEGAQGLLLSERNMHWFPHLTPSDTGATNAMKMLAAVEDQSLIESCDIMYVTRPYLTRHGAGPLPFEVGTDPLYDSVDPTNIPNEWQGTIRYAPLNFDLLREYVNGDFFRCHRDVQGHIMLTCMDHLSDHVHVVNYGERWYMSPDSLYLDLCELFKHMKVHKRYQIGQF